MSRVGEFRLMLRTSSLSSLMVDLAEAARQVEKDIETRANIDLKNALWEAINNIHILSLPKRPRGYWKWVWKHSSNVFLNPYIKHVRVGCGGSIQEFIDRVNKEHGCEKFKLQETTDED